jgi:RNA polymerase sigma factor (TIGR02999 family)
MRLWLHLLFSDFSFQALLCINFGVSEVTRILESVAQGDPKAAEELLPEVYHQLRHLAAARLSHEKPGQTLQATALVHEAWLRIAGLKQHPWHSRAEFFHAAAQAMRRILVENARRKQRRRALEGGERVPLEYTQLISPLPDEELLALDEGLRELAENHPPAAQLVELRFFAGLTQTEAAEQLGISRSTADRLWLLARSWLYARIRLPEEGRRYKGPEQ